MMDSIKIKIVTIVALVFVIFGLGSYAIGLTRQPKTIALKDDTLTFEYGEPVEIDTEYLLDTTDQDIIDSIEVDTSTIKNEKGKDYPAIGKYAADVSYTTSTGTQTTTIMVVVEDTVKPEFVRSVDEVTLAFGDSTHDFNEDFGVSDFSKVTLEFDVSKVNFEKAGTYKATAKAKDAQGNAANKTFTVVIQEAQTQEEPQPEVVVPDQSQTYIQNDQVYVEPSVPQVYDEQYYQSQGYNTYTAPDGTLYYYIGDTIPSELYTQE